MARVCITGGAGFIGSHLCRRFLQEGDEVVCVDNLLTGSRHNIEEFFADRRFTFLEQDVSERLDVANHVDYVLHFASPASPIHYLRYPVETLRVNAFGALKSLELAKRCRATFLLASTSEVYGDPAISPQTEDYWGNVNPVGPRSVYDEGKRFAEALTVAYGRAHGVSTRIVRIFNTFGPGMQIDDGRVIPEFFAQAIRGLPLTVFGDGMQTRSFCFIYDLIDGILLHLKSEHPGPINLGGADEITVLQLAKEIINIVGSDSEIIHEPLPEDDPKRRRPDTTLARNLLGWQPQVDRITGLKRCLEYFRSAVSIQERGTS